MRRALLISLLLLSPQKQNVDKPTSQKQNTQKQVQPSKGTQEMPDSDHSGAVTGTQFYTYNSQKGNDAETAKIIFDGLLVLFTLGLVWVGWKQAKILRKHEEWMQLHDAKLRQLAEAANKNADAARMSAETAEKSLRLAYAASLGIAPFISGGIIVELKNYGRTVARNVMLLGDIADVVDGGKVTPFRIGPLIVPTDAITKAEIGNVTMRQDSYGQPHMPHDVRCNLNVIYEDIFKDTHIRSYVLLFNRDTLKVTVEKESS